MTECGELSEAEARGIASKALAKATLPARVGALSLVPKPTVQLLGLKARPAACAALPVCLACNRRAKGYSK